jgi:arylsulfatase A-like enzyme/Flp pilus assembly protein TadD
MSLIRQLVCVVWLVANALAAATSSVAVAAAGAAVPPNIVLITLDTTRADRMGFLGSTRGLTPNLDKLARESVVFTRAYSQVPLTAPSHATILTGTYPQFHQVNDFGIWLAKDLPYAPDILQAHGYHTAAFIGALVLDPKMHTAPGFDRGFDTYDAGFSETTPGSDRYQTSERRGAVVVAHALAWLDQLRLNPNPPAPFFMWVHLYDPHDPYDPPEPYKSKYKFAPYDGEIAYTDSAVGKLIAELRTRGIYENSVIAVMSDHGEALGDHGEDTHGVFLYDETIHVPLLIKLPDERLAAERIDARVGLVDVLPTILQAAGIAIPPEVQGEALLGISTAAEKSSSPERPIYSETDYAFNTFRWSILRSLRTGKYLFVQAPRRELYDEAADPNAANNLATASKAVADTLSGQLDAFRQKTTTSRQAPEVSLDPALQEKLAALGYLARGSGTSASGTSRDAGADPKDKIDIINKVHKVNLLATAQRYNEAIALLKQVIAKAPDTSVAYRGLGEAYMALLDYKQAIPMLRKAAELRPDWTKEHFLLGVALLATGDAASAVPELEIVVAKVPQSEESHIMLANAYVQTDRAREAVIECEKVLEVTPNDFGALLLEGQILLRSNHAEAALSKLEKAATLEPRAPDPHVFLADAYSQLGRKTDAARERAAARRLAANRKE